MPDGSHHQPQRSHGTAKAAFAVRRGSVRLTDLHQAGSAKVMFPRTTGPVPEVVFLNTSGGLTGGDSLEMTLTLDPQTRITATTQTAERAYASLSGPARVTMTACVGAGSRLDWLPQETLIYQSSDLARRTIIDLAPDATCLLAETVILGRHAMGEVVTHATLSDHRMIRRAGRPVWADSLLLTPATLTSSAPALLGDARAFAVICLVTQGAEDAVATLRAAVPDAAISGWDGKCVLRLTARDGWTLKRQLAQIVPILTGRALPRVWPAGDAP